MRPSQTEIRQRSGSDLRLALDNRALTGREVTIHLGDVSKMATPGSDFMIAKTSSICGCMFMKDAWPPRSLSVLRGDREERRPALLMNFNCARSKTMSLAGPASTGASCFSKSGAVAVSRLPLSFTMIAPAFWARRLFGVGFRGAYELWFLLVLG